MAVEMALMYHVEGPEKMPSRQVYERVLEQVELADALGFDIAWFAEHHFGGHQAHLPQPLLLALHAAARTRRIATGTAVICLPLHHPLDVAEQIAVADVLTGARLQLVLASGSAADFAGFGIDIAERPARFREGLDILLQAWRGQPFRYQGRYYNIPELRLRPVPERPPEQFVWLGAISAGTAWLAGERGLGLALPRGWAPAAYLDPIEAYRNGRAAAGLAREPGRVAVTRMCYVGETDEQARRDVAEAVVAFWRRNRLDDPPALDEILRRLHIVVGGPEAVARELSEVLRVTGATTLTLQPTWECLQHEKSLRSLRLFAQRVRPAL